jgi:hypothetical protein
MARLAEYLRITHSLEPAPGIFLAAEMGVACRGLEAIRDLMEKTLECSRPYSRCAEGLMPVWQETPDPPGTPPA